MQNIAKPELIYFLFEFFYNNCLPDVAFKKKCPVKRNTNQIGKTK